MILPNCRPAYLTPIKIKSTASGPDVIPDPVNWGTAIYTDGASLYQLTEKQITGINQTITLKLTGVWGTNAFVYFLVSNTPMGDGATIDPVMGGYTLISPNGTFTVSNNQYVSFVCDGFPFPGTWPTWTVTVLNNSDSDTTLDTFNCIAQP